MRTSHRHHPTIVLSMVTDKLRLAHGAGPGAAVRAPGGDKPTEDEVESRLLTFSKELFDQLQSHKDFAELQLFGQRQNNSLEFVCDSAKKSILVVGTARRDVDLASQLICNIVRDMTEDSNLRGLDKTVPKHPWDVEPAMRHSNLAQKLSLPPEAEAMWQSPIKPPATGMSKPPPPLGTHLPISRTVSDSYGYQRRSTANFASSRRKLESEDSSYDSDHDNHDYPPTAATGLKLPAVQISRSHDDVSRTPSETLRAEFDEYVTTAKKPVNRTRENSPGVICPPYFKEDAQTSEFYELEAIMRDPAYTAKVEFALRLGYTEDLLQKALVKLGMGAAENQILEELIRLQKSKPGIRDAIVVAAEAPVEPRSELLKSERNLDKTDSDPLLPIVIDGSNVAMSHGNKEVFSCKGIRICVNWFMNRGHKNITVFVPSWRKESSTPDKPITDQNILIEMEKERLLSFTPSRQVQGKRFVCHDDRYILNLAADTGAVVVTNDNYRDLINEKPEYKKVIEEKILMYSFVNDRFMPPDDPFGRNGPSLDQFLRRKSSFNDLQPCPYGKKCTYGNKCKFFHAERGNQPQKSITDKLKEHSSQKISEVRAREHSRDSSPGDPLTRTKSMQPLQRTSEGNIFAQTDKQALCRTQSTFPRVSITQPSMDGGMMNPNPARGHPHQQQQPLFWQAGHGQAQHTMSLGTPFVPLPHLQGQQAVDPSRSFSFENVTEGHNSSWNKPYHTVAMGLDQFGAASGLPDTSLPPPAPRGPWSAPPPPAKADGGAAEVSNLHRQLSRQLTLNPAFDPRIHQATARGQNPPQFPFPPPNLPPQSYLHGGDHSPVTRNASAPEQTTNSTLRASNFDLLGERSTQVKPEALKQTPEDLAHGHIQRLSSTSDSQLHKSLSDVTVANQAAISPLIGSSDGVWETSASSSSVQVENNSEARSKLYFHLASVFSEDQVLQAMRMLPEETDPEKICELIISLKSRQK